MVGKLFVTGSLADAEREFGWGRLAAGAGVIEHLQVGLDAATQRPLLSTRHAAGLDLDQAIAERGALMPAVACAWLQPPASATAT